MKLLVKYFLIVIAGIMLAIAFPPFNKSFMVWVSVMLFISILWNYKYFCDEKKISKKESDSFIKKILKSQFSKRFIPGYIFGLVFFLINLNWIKEVTLFGSFALPAYLAIYSGIFSWFSLSFAYPDLKNILLKSDEITQVNLSRLKNNKHRKSRVDKNVNSLSKKYSFSFAPSFHSIKISFLNASCWTGLEWLRGEVFTGFGWNSLGVGLQNNHDTLIQIVDLVGVYGLSFIIIFCSSLLILTIVRLILEVKMRKFHPHLDFYFALSLLMLCFFYGIVQIKKNNLDQKKSNLKLKILCIQPNLTREDKWDQKLLNDHLNNLEIFTLANSSPNNQFSGSGALESDASSPDQKSQKSQKNTFDLIVWPETAIPTVYSEAEMWLKDLASKISSGLIFGVTNVIEKSNGKEFYNSLGIINNSSSSDVLFYNKIHLVPFGEFIPFRSLIFLLKKIAPQIPDGQDFSRGISNDPLKVKIGEKSFSIIPSICFEDTIGSLTRRFVRSESQIIVNITNDNWFRQSSAVEHHLANARFRAIELRRNLLRCTNTGVTCLINPNGLIVKSFRDNDNSTFITGTSDFEVTIPKNYSKTLYSQIGNSFAILSLYIFLFKIIISKLFSDSSCIR